MAKRKRIPTDIQTELLTKGRRRCCICFSLNQDLTEKKGQIAHLDQDSSNPALDNLAWLCMDHHDEYDSTTRQSKGLTIGEVKSHRDALYVVVEEMIKASLLSGSDVSPREEPDPSTSSTTGSGSGAIARGPGAVAAGERRVAIGGDVHGGIIITGDSNVVRDLDKDEE